ncbi:AbrB/MazE/SpoVT family DNA-binding domain-containing protein [Couchioplanes azureus]|uniref:AbrB/MazE/SpoVT family DNA-binding domain-containing protein n=1 Tax=Couchioplanes caeruleus TaxID=56438 RepID=UPI0016708E67|nr:AbrB/MazE/SpoVT family DNA-binding domain-containing protein [Couchioplanes caeruleus]
MREHSSVYAMVVVEARGRVSVHSVLHALPWDPATRLAVRVQARLVVVTAGAEGESQIDRKGRLQVPVATRRWCGLTQGSRVLLVADTATARLVIHPSAALDATIGRAHAEAFGGDA